MLAVQQEKRAELYRLTAKAVVGHAPFLPFVVQPVQQEQCTALYGVLTMFIAQLALPEFATYDLSSLRKGIMAGSPCPQDIMQKVPSRPPAGCDQQQKQCVVGQQK